MVERSNETPHSPCVEALISDWLKFHVSRLAAPDRYHYSAAHLKTFFNDERRLGRLGEKVMVKDLTPELQARFREWRSASGVGGHTVSRDVAALRGALTWAWKHQRIPRPPPFIADSAIDSGPTSDSTNSVPDTDHPAPDPPGSPALRTGVLRHCLTVLHQRGPRSRGTSQS